MRRMWGLAAMLLASVVLSGCAGNNLGQVFGGSQKYHMVVSATGAVPFENADFGTFSAPTILAGPLINVAAPYLRDMLAEKHNLKDCLFESTGAKPVDGAIVWTGYSLCTLNGVRQTEVLTVRLEPVESSDGPTPAPPASAPPTTTTTTERRGG